MHTSGGNVQCLAEELHRWNRSLGRGELSEWPQLEVIVATESSRFAEVAPITEEWLWNG